MQKSCKNFLNIHVIFQKALHYELMEWKILQSIKTTVSFACLIFIISASTLIPSGQADKIRLHVRNHEFDFAGWTADAVWKKFSMFSLGISHYLSDVQEQKIMDDYNSIHEGVGDLQYQIAEIFSDPNVRNPLDESSELNKRLEQLGIILSSQSLLAEMVIQNQVSRVLGDLNLAVLGQPFPPVLYHVSKLPNNLIVSPRNFIQQDASISLKSDLNLEDIVRIEQKVENSTEYSALVVPVSGISTYPSMVIDTYSFPYLVETVAHEWTHNYLIFRPLGIRYSSSPEMRTMNETTASIVGEEISRMFTERGTSESKNRFSGPSHDHNLEVLYQVFPDEIPDNAPVFDFRKQMYETRLAVDQLLSEGKIEEAEQFMEEQRKIFCENGYMIRKLNQAYFAFYGAYADSPYSAAGADPVGEDVRTLRARSRDLNEFLSRISGMRSYEELRDYIHSF